MTPTGAEGTMNVDGTAVGVTFTGPLNFLTTGPGTNYWNPSAPYLSPTVDNAPPASDIVSLNRGGTKTIAFSRPVKNPLIALVSWNGNTVDFGVPIEVLSFGAGFYGNGTPILNPGGTGFFGNGEVHGVIRLPGTFSQITFTDSTEGWHGFTVGVQELPNNDVPEPASLALASLGLVAVARLRRRSK
ncbi:hypothetical protein TBR22_A40070 [Luteitalea sp. TBR-22]|uniref:PEP-CTERM sorting domain-containing protein n=1 Tax=Luteitalea sp. TBR-22 TaxID=2802971 RepID=UPI001AF1008B|nr:PEP-CTERM sorting domain-containing protein [Luteitalea sp. TBR-22]BCS34781.1 hypothetical protein TBR22_A40070 [Luteitalea sp. TBR-22]